MSIPSSRSYNYYVSFSTRNESGRKAIIEEAIEEASKIVNSDYPYAVFREYQDIMRAGESVFQTWQKGKRDYDDGSFAHIWTREAQERERLFLSAFIGRYQEAVAEKDTKAGKQPTTTPVTSTTGATITVTNVKHDGDIHTYWVRIADPRHFDEAQDFPLPLVVDFSETPISDTSTATIYAPSPSNPMSTSASAGSDVTLPEFRSKTPQKKKPRLYFGKG